MTLPEFGTLINTVDPDATHRGAFQQGNYTVWAEYAPNDGRGDGKLDDRAIKIQIDRFTMIEYDPIVEQITGLLDANGVAFDGPLTTYEPGSGRAHHIWDCEVV